MTGLLVPGRIVGRKELLEHARLERIKQCLDDAMSDEGASYQLGSHSPSHSTPPGLEQESGSIPFVHATPRFLPEGAYCSAVAASTVAHSRPTF
jgi:hypothetical protein